MLVTGEVETSLKRFINALLMVLACKLNDANLCSGGANSECGTGYKDKLCAICDNEIDGKLYDR